MPEKPLARVFYGLTTLSAIAGTTLAFVLYGFGTSGPPDTTPGMFDVYGQNMIGRLADTISYFTTWSNVLVAIVFALLAIRVSRRGHITHVLLFSALLMILVAGLVDNAILAPAVAPRHGWELLTTTLEHTITPLFALFVWAIFGPRDWLSRQLILPALVIPIVWVVFTMLRGAIINAYPYGFLNVVKLGYPMALLDVVGVLVVGIAICFLLIGIDRLARRWSRA
ncbi:MAG: Pr6Pr family membrane protein [Thermoleophilia bacterium]